MPRDNCNEGFASAARSVPRAYTVVPGWLPSTFQSQALGRTRMAEVACDKIALVAWMSAGFGEGKMMGGPAGVCTIARWDPGGGVPGTAVCGGGNRQSQSPGSPNSQLLSALLIVRAELVPSESGKAHPKIVPSEPVLGVPAFRHPPCAPSGSLISGIVQ